MILSGNKKTIVLSQLFTFVHTLFSAIDAVAYRPDSEDVRQRLQESVCFVEKELEKFTQIVYDSGLERDQQVAQQSYLFGMVPGLLLVGISVFVVSPSFLDATTHTIWHLL
jgi:hypothetical protein